MNIEAGKQENKKTVRKMVNHIYQGISGLFAANKLLNTVRYRSLGHLTAPRLCYRKATAPSNAAYCGVMFFNRLITVCVERGGKRMVGENKQRPLQRVKVNESPRWFSWWLRSDLWNQVLMAVR